MAELLNGFIAYFCCSYSIYKRFVLLYYIY